MSILSQLKEPHVANGYCTERPGLVGDMEAGDSNKTDAPGQGARGTFSVPLEHGVGKDLLQG